MIELTMEFRSSTSAGQRHVGSIIISRVSGQWANYAAAALIQRTGRF